VSAAFLSTIVAEPQRWRAGARGARKITPFTLLTGIKDGRHARHTATLAAHYDSDPEPAGAYTAGPLSVAVEMMLRGEVAGQGVLPPEACLDPMRFITALERLWVPPPADGKPIVR
jgi:saccharopine dehydrogenase-like NADP-dependent oxidoreductase